MNRFNSFLVCTLLLVTNLALADLITVSGDVSGTWSVDTVMVVGEIRVPAGESLTIHPGVQVQFTGLYKFIVQGLLTAEGSSTDSIIFTRALPTEESKWRGFRFDAADDASVLEYCRIEYAKGEDVYPDMRGGAIWLNNCSPAVRHCLIAHSYTHNGNYNGAGGGICLNESSFSVIEYNRIALNQADSGGGILVGSDCNATIRYNLIEDNQAFYAGGGIYISANAQSTIYENVIQNNSAGGWGGGGINLWSATWLYGTSSVVHHNLILNNTASDAGGGIYSRYDGSQMYSNTIVENEAGRGGGIYVLTFSYLPPTAFNSIMWGNSAPTGSQIYLDPTPGSTANVTYCDVQDGWTGTGNINADPMFVNTAQSDYRLQWESPCIDTGNPAPAFNDLDGTRADMGAFYYDQSMPVRILLTPYDQPIEIPAGGGSFDYTIQATNSDSIPHSVNIWCNATLPNGTIYGPVLGPVTVTLGAGATLSRQRTQSVPGGAPTGPYSYNAFAVVGADTSSDSFAFVKLGAGGLDGASGWVNVGDTMEYDASLRVSEVIPATFYLEQNFPNPFNPTTTLRFGLPDAEQVTLEVFDVSGRKVVTVESSKSSLQPGVHSLIFDGSNLSAGIYIARLTAGEHTASQKMVLVK